MSRRGVERYQSLRDLHNLTILNPVYACAFYFLLFSLSGLPPFALFFGKVFIYSFIFESAPLLFLVIFIITALFVAFYLRFMLNFGASFYTKFDFHIFRVGVSIQNGISFLLQQQPKVLLFCILPSLLILLSGVWGSVDSLFLVLRWLLLI